MQTHTPGPWFVDQQGAPTVRTSNGTVVCGVPTNPSDAILIAAAPDMLHALKQLAASGLLDTLLEMDKAMADDGDDPIAAPHINRILDAIAKAEGRL